MTPEQRLQQKRNEIIAKDAAYGRYREAMDALAKYRTPAVEQAVTIQKEPAEAPVTSTMAEFVRQDREARLPAIHRQDELVNRQRIALGGKPMQKD